MDRSKNNNSVSPTHTPTNHTVDFQKTGCKPNKNKKHIPNKDSSFAVQRHQRRSISSKKSIFSVTEFFKSISIPKKDQFKNKCLKFIKKFKSKKTKKTKIFLAAALVLLVPILGTIVVSFYVLASYKIARDEKLESITPNYSIIPEDDDFKDFHDLFETQGLNTNLYDDATERKISEKKVRKYLVDIFQQTLGKSDDLRIANINVLIFTITPYLTDFLNSKSNNQVLVNKAIKSVLLYIEDEELAKLTDFFKVLKNDKVLIASLTDDDIATITMNALDDLIAGKSE